MTNKRVLFQREQFQLLCEAKRLVAREFDKNLPLQAADLMEQLSVYARESKQAKLNNIHEKIALGQVAIKSSMPSKKSQSSPLTSPKVRSTKTDEKIKVGDIVDGKICSGFYRGQPVFN